MEQAYKNKSKPGNKFFETALYVILALVSILMIFPLLYVLIVSVSDIQSFSTNILSFVTNLKLQNYADAWKTARIPLYGFNTIAVLAISLVLIVLSSSMCAYAVRRFKFKEIGFLYYFLISGLFIPVQAVILPLFKTLKSLGMLNSLIGLAIVYTALQLPLSMMIFTGFFKSIPMELEESATIDGCGPMKAFWLIIFPLSKTIIATVAILCGLTIWRDFFIPLVIVTAPTKKTLGVGLLSFVNEFSLDWTKMCAAMVMQTIPIVILFLFLQKYFIGGAVAGAIKG